MVSKIVLKGRGIVPGGCGGRAIVADIPVGISGKGIELETGTFKWKGHPLDGVSIKDKILIMPTGKGSSGGDWALYALSSFFNTAPKAIVCNKVDLFTASGAILGEIPLIDRLEKDICKIIETGDFVKVDTSKGIIEVFKDKRIVVDEEKYKRKISWSASATKTNMALSDEEIAMLEGKYGDGVAKCMDYLIKMGDVFGAERMIPICNAHPAACGYKVAGEGAVRFLEWLVETGARVRITATTNPTCIDHKRWQEVMRVPEHFYQNQMRMNRAFIELGFIPSYTCIPYWTDVAPKFGDHVAWGEHNAVCYANSVIGARSNFEAHATAIPAAITGKIPEHGQHLIENRRPQVIVRVTMEMEDSTDWIYLGHYVSQVLLDTIPIFVGLPKTISTQQLRDLVTSMGPPLAKIPMIHIEGVTPEAPDIKTAFRGKGSDLETLVVGRKQINEIKSCIWNGTRKKIELVTLGCPHYRIEDIEKVATALDGRKVHSDIQFWIWTNWINRALAKKKGLLEIIERARGQILTDTCASVCPLAECGHNFKTIVTDSGKTAASIAREGKIETYLGNLNQCIEAAISGEWTF